MSSSVAFDVVVVESVVWAEVCLLFALFILSDGLAYWGTETCGLGCLLFAATTLTVWLRGETPHVGATGEGCLWK